eukprot:CAMPEP_0119418694 /NCGR_PEP_ID=MMETSP1335-20130426/18923_1 /TAXON_ID=259385 /ORGANISM="Chrysoculter rhomboideus, Strain RCC1486" /LENGTH=113 /DNA_ID=CAMNT_0007443959 /DNA_START=170 /DNA_END=507 /DNA_ORIENTATION=+
MVISQLFVACGPQSLDGFAEEAAVLAVAIFPLATLAILVQEPILEGVLARDDDPSFPGACEFAAVGEDKHALAVELSILEIANVGRAGWENILPFALEPAVDDVTLVAAACVV